MILKMLMMPITTFSAQYTATIANVLQPNATTPISGIAFAMRRLVVDGRCREAFVILPDGG